MVCLATVFLSFNALLLVHGVPVKLAIESDLSTTTEDSADSDVDDSTDSNNLTTNDDDFTEPQRPRFSVASSNSVPMYANAYTYGKDLGSYIAQKPYSRSNTEESSDDDDKPRMKKVVKPSQSALPTRTEYVELGEPTYTADLPVFDPRILMKLRKQGLRMEK